MKEVDSVSKGTRQVRVGKLEETVRNMNKRVASLEGYRDSIQEPYSLDKFVMGVMHGQIEELKLMVHMLKVAYDLEVE